MEKNIKVIRIITVITVVLICLCAVILSFQLIQIANLKDKNNQLNFRKEQLIQDIYNYNTANSYYNNNRSEYLESYAREMLGWGESGETWYTKS